MLSKVDPSEFPRSHKLIDCLTGFGCQYALMKHKLHVRPALVESCGCFETAAPKRDEHCGRRQSLHGNMVWCRTPSREFPHSGLVGVTVCTYLDYMLSVTIMDVGRQQAPALPLLHGRLQHPDAGRQPPRVTWHADSCLVSVLSGHTIA